MGTPGIIGRYGSSRALASLPLLALLCLGCGNPFTQFYRGETITDVRREGWVVDVAPSTVECVPVHRSYYIDTFRNYLADGWLYMGGAAWTGDPGSAAQAEEQAKRIGASLVLYSYEYRGTSTGSVPITSPTVSTTYGTGTAYGPSGTSAAWSGTATTYGTQTTMMSVPIHTYSTQSSFFCRRLEPPVFGVIPRRTTTDEQRSYGTVNGIMVDIVIRRSPAADAGLLPGDLLLRVGVQPTDDINAISTISRTMRGQTVEIEFIRQGHPQRIKRFVTMNP